MGIDELNHLDLKGYHDKVHPKLQEWVEAALASQNEANVPDLIHMAAFCITKELIGRVPEEFELSVLPIEGMLRVAVLLGYRLHQDSLKDND